ncbi:MAG: 50S ribosomal protein L29 [Verrucomicrobiota bacterium]|jgi:large subunit ribosomal protein L29
MAKTPLNELTAQELVARAGDLRRDLFNLRLQKATARLDKPHRIKEIRREIARCETRLAALRVAGAKAA